MSLPRTPSALGLIASEYCTNARGSEYQKSTDKRKRHGNDTAHEADVVLPSPVPDDDSNSG